jgi:hypothetical protein
VLDGRIDRWVAKGGSFEFVILDPKSPAARLFSDNIYGQKKFNEFCNDLQRTITKLTEYKSACRNDASIRISLNNQVPPFKMIAVYGSMPIHRDGITTFDGILPEIIKVINYSEKIPHDEWLCYTLDKGNEVPYEYYRKQLNMIRGRLYPPLTIEQLKEMVKNWEKIKVAN